MKLEDLEIYQMAMTLGEKVWDVVLEWENLAKFTMGQQIIKSTDSIAANISEGFGRYHFKDRKQFMLYARGSLFETKTWMQKAYNRNLIEEELYKVEIQNIEKLGVKINNYISTLNKNINKN